MKRLVNSFCIVALWANLAYGAITFANLGTSANPDINSNTDLSSYSNSSWTPPTSGLIIVFVVQRGIAGNHVEPTMSGNSLTWVSIVSLAGASDSRITLFGANASGSSTGATTIDYASNTQQHTGASFFHVTGVDLSGGVAAAFVQKPTNSGTGTSASVTLSAAGNSNNRPIFGIRKFVNETITPRTNWTEIDYLGADYGFETQWRTDAFETTGSATWTTSGGWLAIAAELKAELSTRRQHRTIITQ